jgi:EAL domain-containing protein (putative c-di-GMP-specific phosphodiesterase class I)/CheY-like chemotaxis protein
MADKALCILVVDDEAAMREVLEMRLRQWGHEVFLAATGAEALEVAARRAPDAVISDVVLPDRSGLELVGQLLALDPHRPVVLITAYGTIDVAVEAMKLGALDFLTKPIDPDKLAATLAVAAGEIERSNGARALEKRLVERADFLRQSEAVFGALLEQGLVCPLFQPMVSLVDGTIAGFELLSRGTLEGAEALPTELFSIAERLGRELELSELFRTAGLRHAERISGQPLLFLNTHPAEIRAPDELMESLAKARQRHASIRLVLEIHEAAVAEPADLRHLRHALRELEIQIAFDDFGTGQSRLLELAEVPPDFVKFDMRFVRDLHMAPVRRRDILHSLVRLTRDSGIVPIAEGIETAEEARACQAVGFELAQGYHLGLPTPLTGLSAPP